MLSLGLFEENWISFVKCYGIEIDEIF